MADAKPTVLDSKFWFVVREARRLNLCMLCRKPPGPLPTSGIVSHDSRVFAHERCLRSLRRMPEK